MVENNEEINDTEVESNSKLSNIISTLRSVFLLEQLAGIHRFSFKEGQLLPPNCMKKIYALLLLVCSISLYIAFLRLPIEMDGSISYVDLLEELPCVIILIQYVTTLITTNVFYTHANKEIFTMLANLDGQLVTTGHEEFYRKAKMKTDMIMWLLVVSHITISVIDISSDDEDMEISFIMYLPLCLIHKLEIVAFCLLIETLKSRLDIINGYMKKFLEERDSERMSVFTVDKGKEVKDITNIIGCPSENNTKIRDLAIMYDTIGSIGSTINCIFNFHIFMTLVSTFSFIVITIWTSLYYYKTPENDAGPLLSIIMWGLSALLMVVVMCFVCERIRISRNNTSLLVNQIVMDYKLPKIMRVQAKAFMEIIDAWPLCIMMYDMFSVDITLILKFISVSTTYLIVLIQISHFR